jgi:hypothetical protein
MARKNKVLPVHVTRPQKITFAEMRAAGLRRVLIYLADYRCGHCNIVADDADRWPDELRISDIEDKFGCTACGTRGAVTARCGQK